jgi:hypothetical protein
MSTIWQKLSNTELVQVAYRTKMSKNRSGKHPILKKAFNTGVGVLLLQTKTVTPMRRGHRWFFIYKFSLWFM